MPDPVKVGLIVGVDPGKVTGLAVIKVDVPKSKWELVMREDGAGLWQLYTKLLALMQTTYAGMAPVLALSMEQLMAYKIAAQEKAEAQGITRLSAYVCRVPIYTYAPTTVRSIVVGSGKAKASDIAAALRTLAGLERTKKGEAFTPHQQDALAAALCCAVKESWLKSIAPQEAASETDIVHQAEPKRKYPAR
jgi:Holliday junction resolvasome RuvABC endonuclease subunit